MAANSENPDQLGWRTESDGSIRIDMRIGAEQARVLRAVAIPGDTVASAFRRLCAHIITQQEALDYYGRRQAILEKSLIDAMDGFKLLAKEYGELSGGLRAVASNTVKIEGRLHGSQGRIVELTDFIAERTKELEKSSSSMVNLGQRQIDVYAGLEYLADYLKNVADVSVEALNLYYKNRTVSSNAGVRNKKNTGE